MSVIDTLKAEIQILEAEVCDEVEKLFGSDDADTDLSLDEPAAPEGSDAPVPVAPV